MSESTTSNTVPCYRWFQCNDAFIALDQNATDILSELGIEENQQASVTDLIDAVLLSEHEPLLQCLAALRDEDLDWSPVISPSNLLPESQPESVAPAEDAAPQNTLHEMTHVPRITAMLKSLEGVQRTVYLAMPIEKLGGLPEIPESWQSLVELHICAHQYHPCIESLVLTDEEVEKLTAGSLVLVSASYDSTWSITMTPPESQSANANRLPKTLGASIDRDSETICLHTEAEAEPAETFETDSVNYTRLILKQPVEINHLYNESQRQSGMGVEIKLATGLEGAEVRVVKPALSGQKPDEYQGALMRVGTGYGVLINEQVD